MMKRLVSGVALMSLAGCAAFPPMYPVFEEGSKTGANSGFDMRVGNSPIVTVPLTVEKLYQQRKTYQDQADQAQKALYQTGDGVMLGALVGAVGGLVGNVATVASGAGIATVSGVMGTRYALAAQRNIYNDAAKKVSCLIVVANSYDGQGGASPRIPSALQQGAEDILSQLRGQLGELTPPPVDAASLIALFSRYKSLSPTQVDTLTTDDAAKIQLEKNTLIDISACVKTGQSISSQVPP